jgi:hypothetical protein
MRSLEVACVPWGTTRTNAIRSDFPLDGAGMRGPKRWTSAAADSSLRTPRVRRGDRPSLLVGEGVGIVDREEGRHLGRGHQPHEVQVERREPFERTDRGERAVGILAQAVPAHQRGSALEEVAPVAVAAAERAIEVGEPTVTGLVREHGERRLGEGITGRARWGRGVVRPEREVVHED